MLQACEEAPPAKRKQFYSMWADFEERHGLARHCFAVYERAAAAVPKKERAEVYRLFVAKAKALVGIPKVRTLVPRRVAPSVLRRLCSSAESM